MNIEQFREYCISKEAVTESFPFNETTLVFKVYGKMFALCDIELFEYANLKCDADKALELREMFSAVKPGYHMSKKHWNSVYFHEDLPEKDILKLVDHSYELIIQSISKRKKEKWEEENSST
ncbi:MAG: MmcQ/YjbR family DNA-binding protein [Vicingaceae bacterium]